MGRFFRSSLRTGRIYRSSNYGQFTQSMSPNYKNQWLADGGHRPRQSIDVERPPPLQQTFAPIATKVRPPITGLPKETPPRLLREQEFAPCSAENCGTRAFCFTNSVASTRAATVCLKSDGLNCRVLDRFQGCLPVALMGLLLHALHSKDMTVVMIPQLLHAPKHDQGEEPGA